MKSTIDQSKQITYKIHKAVFILDKISEQILRDRHRIGFSQFLVMMVLADQPKAPQKFVAQSLDQTQAAVSRQVDILVDLGLVSRDKNPESRREYVLSLTKSGEKKFKAGLDDIDIRFNKLFSVLDKHEKTILLQSLDKILREIRNKAVHT